MQAAKAAATRKSRGVVARAAGAGVHARPGLRRRELKGLLKRHQRRQRR
jgi:hypothetical protein